MKIKDVKSLRIPEVKVICFERFLDHRGYFTEHFRKSDLFTHPDLDCFQKVEFVQCNESYSKKGTVRGLHFQWNPLMGKLIRTIRGRMVDMVMDIRKGSPTFGKIMLYDICKNGWKTKILINLFFDRIDRIFLSVAHNSQLTTHH